MTDAPQIPPKPPATQFLPQDTVPSSPHAFSTPTSIVIHERRTLGEHVNTWVQIIAIIAAGIWALWTFWHREEVAPRKQPAHVNVELDLTPAGRRDGLAAIEMTVLVENTSSRTVYFLPVLFRAWGENSDRVALAQEVFLAAAQQVVAGPGIEQAQRFGARTGRELLAAGRLFENWNLNPRERARRTIIIYLPSDAYDRVVAAASFPMSHEPDGLAIEWNVEDIGKSRFTWKGQQTDWHELRLKEDTGFGFATARSELALWRSDGSDGSAVEESGAVPMTGLIETP